jgi:hypothetical protein
MGVRNEQRVRKTGSGNADGHASWLQRHVLYLGEINSSQEPASRKSIEVFEDLEDSRCRG